MDEIELMRSSVDEKIQQVANVEAFRYLHAEEAKPLLHVPQRSENPATSPTEAAYASLRTLTEYSSPARGVENDSASFNFWFYKDWRLDVWSAQMLIMNERMGCSEGKQIGSAVILSVITYNAIYNSNGAKMNSSILRAVVIFHLVTLIATLPLAGHTCSTFALHTDHGTLFGRNTDGEFVTGEIFINKRGVCKQSLPWGFAGPEFHEQEREHWKSKYGSLTFSHFGREFPDGGVNEAGLIIEEMSLGNSLYPQSEGRPSVSVQQWIQYQLDNFATVNEVIGHVDRFNLRGWPWHFTAADRQGNCAIIEFQDQTPIISRGTLENGCVLTNDPLSEALKHLEPQESSLNLSEGKGSIERFVRAHELLADPVPSSYSARRDYAFAVLGNIAQGESTFRSIVYDLGAMKVYFRSHNHPGIKEVVLEKVDFATDTPVRSLDIETAGEGDVTSDFNHYNTEVNRRVVEGAYRLVRATPWAAAAMDEELEAAGVTEIDFVTAIANYPETTRAGCEAN